MRNTDFSHYFSSEAGTKFIMGVGLFKQKLVAWELARGLVTCKEDTCITKTHFDHFVNTRYREARLDSLVPIRLI